VGFFSKEGSSLTTKVPGKRITTFISEGKLLVRKNGRRSQGVPEDTSQGTPSREDNEGLPIAVCQERITDKRKTGKMASRNGSSGRLGKKRREERCRRSQVGSRKRRRGTVRENSGESLIRGTATKGRGERVITRNRKGEGGSSVTSSGTSLQKEI